MGKRPTAKQLEKSVKDLQQTASLIVRMPEGMRRAVAETAARNGRSMNAEIVFALAVHLAQEGLTTDERLTQGVVVRLKVALDTIIRDVAADEVRKFRQTIDQPPTKTEQKK